MTEWSVSAGDKTLTITAETGSGRLLLRIAPSDQPEHGMTFPADLDAAQRIRLMMASGISVAGHDQR